VTWQIQLPEVGVHLVLYWTTVGGAYVIRSRIQLHDREQQAAQLALEKSQLESTLRQAELETLPGPLESAFPIQLPAKYFCPHSGRSAKCQPKCWPV